MEVRKGGPPEYEFELRNGQAAISGKETFAEAHCRQWSHRSCGCTASGTNTIQTHLIAMSEGFSVPTHGTTRWKEEGTGRDEKRFTRRPFIYTRHSKLQARISARAHARVLGEQLPTQSGHQMRSR